MASGMGGFGGYGGMQGGYGMQPFRGMQNTSYGYGAAPRSMSQGYGMSQGAGMGMPDMQPQVWQPQQSNPAFGSMAYPQGMGNMQPWGAQPMSSIMSPAMDPTQDMRYPRMQQARRSRGGYVPPGMEPISTTSVDQVM